MAIKIKLKIAFAILTTVLTPVAALLLPILIKIRHLNIYQSFSLAVLSIILFNLGFFLIVDLVYGLALEEFQKQLGDSWKKYGSLRKFKLKNRPAELQNLYNLFNDILQQLEKKTIVLQKAKTLDKLKFDFIATASHQLRTPITGVKWALSAIFNRPDIQRNNDLKNQLTDVLNSVNRTSDLLNQLLEAVQPTDNSLSRKKTVLNLEKIIKNIVKENYLFTNSKGIKIKIINKKNGIPSIIGNERQLQMVFQNIINNAIVYSYNGGKISIIIDYDGEFVITAVQDEGIGIPRQEQEQIFNRFFRGDKATQTHTAGSGLGLFLSKAIIDQHDGEISFVSGLPKIAGSIFTVKLPIKQKGQLETFIQY